MSNKECIPITRLDLAKLMKVHGLNVHLAVDDVMRLHHLKYDKRKSLSSLLVKNLSRILAAIGCVEIPWKSASIDLQQSAVLLDTENYGDFDFKVELNIERRKPLDEIQVRSKKIRLDQTGIPSSIRHLAILENISVLRYIALLLYIVASGETDFKSIVLLGRSIQVNLCNILVI